MKRWGTEEYSCEAGEASTRGYKEGRALTSTEDTIVSAITIPTDISHVESYYLVN